MLVTGILQVGPLCVALVKPRYNTALPCIACITEVCELIVAVYASRNGVLLGVGEQVVEPGTITQVPPETTQEMTVSSTEPTASPGPANGAAGRALKTKLISPGAGSQKALVTRQESKLSATSQKPTTARYGGGILSNDTR